MQATLFELNQECSDLTSWFDEMLNYFQVYEEAGWPDRFGRQMRGFLHCNIRPIRTLSLFSGGGGLDIAFHDAGFEVVEMVEIEAKYARTLEYNVQQNQHLEKTKVTCKDIRQYQPDPELQVDFIIGGPPCQTFSAAGRRASGVTGVDDPRGTLFEEYVRLLNILKPQGFLFENVYGITGAQNGTAWQEIQSAFKSAGYSIFFRVLDAADYGVPQHRERLFIIGLKTGSFLFPYPTHGPDAPDNRPYYAAGKAINDLLLSDQKIGIGGKFGDLLFDIPPGLNYSFYTKEMGHPSPVFGWRSKFSDFLYKADPELPVRTIKAQGGQYTGPFSWENRPFAIEELKRLQTFPDDYQILGSRQVCIEQIGNSVPPQIGRILALSILDQVFGINLPFEIKYLPKDAQLSFRSRKRKLTASYIMKAKDAINDLNYPQVNRIGNNVLHEGRLIRYISKDFEWSDTQKKSYSTISFYVERNENELIVSVNKNNKEDIKYSIELQSAVDNDWMLQYKKINLHSYDWSDYAFTALWKIFEEIINKEYGIADIVQLSGYYQYNPKILSKMSFTSDKADDSFWIIIKHIVEGFNVGTLIDESQITSFWPIDNKEILPYFKRLRTMGYEIRNSNTNSQIPLGKYLIPYNFPTLNSRSVQLRKRLDANNE